MDSKKRLELIKSINKLCRSDSILIVLPKGKLHRLRCPFKVKVVRAVHTFKFDERLLVEAVLMDLNLILVYRISGQSYYYYYFEVLLE